MSGATIGPWTRGLLPLVALLAATVGAAASGEEGNASEVFALRGIRLIDGLGGSPVEDAVLLIRDGRILAAGSAQVVSTPADATVIDYAGKTVMPGLISSHSELGIDDARIGTGDDARRYVLRQLRQYEAYGVTTVTALGWNAAFFEELRRDLHAGMEQGADLFGAVRGIGAPNGALRAHGVPVAHDPLDRPASAEAARRAVRELAGRDSDLVELWLGDGDGTQPGTMRAEVYQAVIDEAHGHGLRVAAHVRDLESARALVAAGADVIVHGIHDRPVDAAFVELLRRRGVWYVPTLALDEATFVYAERPSWTERPFFHAALDGALQIRLAEARVAPAPAAATARRALALNQRNLATLQEAGVRIGFGAGSGATPLLIPGVAEHRELALMVAAGLRPSEAITIATSEAAASLGLSDRGALVSGRWADLVVLDEDPTQSIDATTSVYAVWHRGVPTRALATARARYESARRDERAPLR